MRRDNVTLHSGSVISEAPKRDYVFKLFGLTAFLSLLSPTLILALPVLMLNLISPNAVQFSLNYQYGALVYPFLLVAMAEGLVNLSCWLGRNPERRPRLVAGGMLGLLLLALVGNLTLNNVVKTAIGNRETPQRAATSSIRVPP